jgi:ubiquinone/menaquinone biosynthesis C-methylase UbiE
VDPRFPFADSSFDVVTCVVSVDYLTKPLEVFKEISRVLRPGGGWVGGLGGGVLRMPSRGLRIASG